MSSFPPNPPQMTPPSPPPKAEYLPQPALKRRLPAMQELGLVVVIGILYVILSIAGHNYSTLPGFNLFLNFETQFNGIATYTSIYAIMAVGMTAVIITGGIDISVGSILVLSGIGAAHVLQNLPNDMPAWQVLPIALGLTLGIGGLCGLFNGLMVVGMRMHPFIVTLGTMSIYRGIATVTTKVATLPEGAKNFPVAFTKGFMKHEYFTVKDNGFPVGIALTPVLIMLAVVIIGTLFLQFMVAGRETYAVGGNAEAARFSGIRVWWVTLRVYILVGLCAGLAAFVSLGRFGTMSTQTGTGDELTVIAAAVVGGASLTGGRGTALGALLGALIMKLIENGIVTLKWNTEYSKIVIGASIIIAVAVDRLSEYLARRRESRKPKSA